MLYAAFKITASAAEMEKGVFFQKDSNFTPYLKKLYLIAIQGLSRGSEKW